jgi:hypothetical protein
VLGVDPQHVHRGLVRDAAVGERLAQALVGIPELDVLAHDRDAVSGAGDLTRRTTLSHRDRSIRRGSSPRSFTMISSSPSRWNTSGTS